MLHWLWRFWQKSHHQRALLWTKCFPDRSIYQQLIPDAGWYTTSVLFVLIVSCHRLETRSIASCIFFSALEFFAMSSIYRSSFSTSVCTLDLACKLLRLNSLPSKRYLIGKPASQSWKASVSMVENIMLNSVGASTQPCLTPFGPRQANLVLITYASSEGSGEPAHPRSLARTFAARSYKQWVKRNLQTESQIPGPSEWLGMRS